MGIVPLTTGNQPASRAVEDFSLLPHAIAEKCPHCMWQQHISLSIPPLHHCTPLCIPPLHHYYIIVYTSIISLLHHCVYLHYITITSLCIPPLHHCTSLCIPPLHHYYTIVYTSIISLLHHCVYLHYITITSLCIPPSYHYYIIVYTYYYIIVYTSITSLLHHCITISIHLEHGPPHLLCMYGFLLGCLATNPDVDNTSFTVFKWHL